MKVLAIGDIHTKTWIFNAVAQILDQYDKVVFVGDYADDWKASPAKTIMTWTALKTLQEVAPDKVCAVIGNHDYIYVNRTSTISSGYNQITKVLIDAQENFALKMWLKLLPVTLELDGVTYSHAGVYFNWKDGDPLWDDYSPIWARPDFTTYKDMPQVFGHTPSKTCWEVQPNVWCIDTFSTAPDGTPIGDQTALEITDGKTFTVINLKDEADDNDNTNRKSQHLSRAGD